MLIVLCAVGSLHNKNRSAQKVIAVISCSPFPPVQHDSTVLARIIAFRVPPYSTDTTPVVDKRRGDCFYVPSLNTRSNDPDLSLPIAKIPPENQLNFYTTPFVHLQFSPGFVKLPTIAVVREILSAKTEKYDVRESIGEKR